MDETTAPVLDPRRGTTKTGYFWALARDGQPSDRRCASGATGGEDPPGVVYFCGAGRAGDNAETFLTGFDGTLQIPSHGLQANHERGIDGYPDYNRLARLSRKGGSPVFVAHCWAYARRKLEEVFEGAIFQYSNRFYNPRRRHSSLGGKSPLNFERKAA